MSAFDGGANPPLTRRPAVVQLLRVVLAAAVAGVGFLDGDMELLPLVAAYLTLTLGIELLRRRGRGWAPATSSWTLLVDGLFLGVAVALTGGADSRIVPLVFFDVIAVTLVVSYRTGLELAVWYALLLFLGQGACSAGFLGDRTTGSYADAALIAIGLLLFAAGAALCSSVSERALRRSRAELNALVELGSELERVRGADEVAAALAAHVHTRLGFGRAVVLVRQGDGWVGASATGGRTAPVAGPDELGTVAGGGWDAETSTLLRSLAGEPVLDARMPDAGNVVVPLVVDDEALGVVLAEWGRGRRAQVPPGRVETVAQSASQAAVVLRNAALLSEVEHHATRDGLTGLANRRLFEETLQREVARSIRRTAPLALVVVDVDHFKDVNDTVGHQAGDAVLREIARAMVANTKASDLPARYGGDEFVVLLPDCTGVDALGVAERLRAAVAREVTVVPVTVSAGVGAMPENAGDGDQLVAAADAALYAAKGEGRNRSVRSSRIADADDVPPHPSLRGRVGSPPGAHCPEPDGSPTGSGGRAAPSAGRR